MIGSLRPASALTPAPKLLASAFFILSWLSWSTRAQGAMQVYMHSLASHPHDMTCPADIYGATYYMLEITAHNLGRFIVHYTESLTERVPVR